MIKMEILEFRKKIDQLVVRKMKIFNQVVDLRAEYWTMTEPEQVKIAKKIDHLLERRIKMVNQLVELRAEYFRLKELEQETLKALLMKKKADVI